jgi:hypothetical protein
VASARALKTQRKLKVLSVIDIELLKLCFKAKDGKYDFSGFSLNSNQPTLNRHADMIDF